MGQQLLEFFNRNLFVLSLLPLLLRRPSPLQMAPLPLSTPPSSLPFLFLPFPFPLCHCTFGTFLSVSPFDLLPAPHSPSPASRKTLSFFFS
jgi:hypothetical protein